MSCAACAADSGEYRRTPPCCRGGGAALVGQPSARAPQRGKHDTAHAHDTWLLIVGLEGGEQLLLQ